MTQPDGSGADTGPDGEEAIRKLLELDRELLAELETGLLSHDFRLILQAVATTDLIVKDASSSSRLSGRAFHQLLRRLEQAGILRFVPNPQDRRAKSIVIADDFVKLLQEQLRD